MAKPKRRSDCPINFGLQIFGDSWSLLIIRDLAFKGKHHYGEFLKGEERISTNILADRLDRLEEEGIVFKRKDPTNGTKFIYDLTAKGIDLVPMLVELITWSAKHDPQSAAAKGFVRKAKRNRRDLISRIQKGLYPDH